MEMNSLEDAFVNIGLESAIPIKMDIPSSLKTSNSIPFSPQSFLLFVDRFRI